MKLLSLFLSAMLLFSCSTKAPEKNYRDVTPQWVIDAYSKKPTDKILEIASASSCASYKWKDRGLAPMEYIKGMAMAYANGFCKGSMIAGDEKLGPKEKDALAYYGMDKGSRKTTYALLIGLGMRESSGIYCEGRDASASNVKSNEAEAGMFQTSFNSVGASSELRLLFEKYKNGGEKCFLEVFQGPKCSPAMLKTWGDGEGAEFQKLAKNCPAFASEYASVTLRALRKHYGPINRKEAEFRPECLDMLNQIELAIKSDSRICQNL